MENINNVCISGHADNTNNSPLTKSDATMRLQQAAHILVTGAIRAAQKHKSDANKRAEKPTKSAAFPTSEYHTLGEIGCKKVQKSPAKKKSKASKSNSSGKKQGGKVQ